MNQSLSPHGKMFKEKNIGKIILTANGDIKIQNEKMTVVERRQ